MNKNQDGSREHSKDSSQKNHSSKLHTVFLVVLLCVAAAAVGFAISSRLQQNKLEDQYSLTKTRKAPDNVQRPAFQLTDLEGKLRNINEWDGKVILLNFWATWCPPCRKEIPAFIDLQEKYGPSGFQVIGVAIDQPSLVEAYSDGMGINYPLLVGNDDAINVGTEYGNRLGLLPYSVIINHEGMIRFIKKGEVTREEVEEMIIPLLKEKNAADSTETVKNP